ncbi:MAG: beta-ketoacyl synthase chain length factor [Lentisphaeria bacterium]|nr:beta-ketoacyl synthase chain length factor [Lentisphaeria bacterium]
MYLNKIISGVQYSGQKAYAEIKRKYEIPRLPEYFLHLLQTADSLEIPTEKLPRMGILYVSHLGPMGQIVHFMNDLMDYTPDQVSPKYFSHGVFNAPTAYLSRYLGCHGPALSLCGFSRIIESSIRTAASWLATGSCENILLIFSDEDIPFSQEISSMTGLQRFLPTHALWLSSEPDDPNAKQITADDLIQQITVINQQEQ